MELNSINHKRLAAFPLFLFPFSCLWERYFFKEFFKVFIFFLFCFYSLYILIDFSNHANRFYYATSFQLDEFLLYYFCDFIKQLEVLLPFALLISTIKTVINFHIHHELLALMAAGLKIKLLLRPFLLIGLACVGLLYVNTEWLLPDALKNLRASHERRHFKEERSLASSQTSTSAQHLILKDGSIFLFLYFDALKSYFFDTYWIPNLQEVYHIKYLHSSSQIPLGTCVDYFVRDKEGALILNYSAPSQEFPQLIFDSAILVNTLNASEEFSLTLLKQKIKQTSGPINERQAEFLTTFYYKLLIPWLCLIAIVGPASICISYKRQLPIFFIYASSIFGLVLVYLLLDAALILGKKQLLSPGLAILLPFGLFFGFFSWRFAKL